MTEDGAKDVPGADRGAARVGERSAARVPTRTGRPLYEQLADDLRTKISEGVYAVGAPLPSTSRLMREYGVSITAARAAVGVLKHEGIVIGQPGKAIYVQRPVERGDAAEPDVQAQLDRLRAMVLDLTRRVAELEQASRPRRPR